MVLGKGTGKESRMWRNLIRTNENLARGNELQAAQTPPNPEIYPEFAIQTTKSQKNSQDDSKDHNHNPRYSLSGSNVCSESSGDDIISYGGKVNKAVEELEFQNCTIDHFKCPMFVCELKAPHYADIRTRILSRIEGETAEKPVSSPNLDWGVPTIGQLESGHNDDRATIKPEVISSCGFGQENLETSAAFNDDGSENPAYSLLAMRTNAFCSRHCPFSSHQSKTCNQTGHKTSI